MNQLSVTEVQRLFAIALALFVPAMILARLALWSARTRLCRVRRAAEALTEDIVTLVQKGEQERACDVAGSHGSPFSTELVRVLRAVAPRRARLVEEIGEQWRSGPSQGTTLAYGCFLWLVAGVAAACSCWFVLLSVGLGQIRGLERVLCYSAAVLAGGIGLAVLWSIRKRLLEAQEALGASCYALLRRVATMMDFQVPR